MDKEDVIYIDIVIDKEDTHIHTMEYYLAIQRMKFCHLQQHG